MSRSIDGSQHRMNPPKAEDKPSRDEAEKTVWNPKECQDCPEVTCTVSDRILLGTLGSSNVPEPPDKLKIGSSSSESGAPAPFGPTLPNRNKKVGEGSSVDYEPQDRMLRMDGGKDELSARVSSMKVDQLNKWGQERYFSEILGQSSY